MSCRLWLSALIQTFVVATIVTSGPARAAEDEKLKIGREIFLKTAEPQCAVCHTLADAGSAGKIGPNLNEMAPDEERVKAAVTGGIGVMPAFGDTLTAEQVAAVSYYVATVVRPVK